MTSYSTVGTLSFTRRFIDGGYAWAMQDAMMVGYIRAGRTISVHLAPAFAQRQSPLGAKGVPVQPITPNRSIGA